MADLNSSNNSSTKIKKGILGKNYKKVDYMTENVYLICNFVIAFRVISEIKNHPKSYENLE